MELEGYKDHWVKNINDPKDTRWEYTYHGRLHNYGVWKEKNEDGSYETGHFKVDEAVQKVRLTVIPAQAGICKFLIMRFLHSQE